MVRTVRWRLAKEGVGMDELQRINERIEAIGEQLQAKIRSKFQASTFLGGFAFTLLGTQISRLWQPTEIPQLLPVSIPVMFVAVGLYIRAIVKLDELTMPKRFWEEGDGVLGIPRLGYLSDQDLWELRKRMIFYWQRLTIGATILTVVSLFLMLLPLPSREFSVESGDRVALLSETFAYTLIFLCLMIAYLVGMHREERRKFETLLRPRD
jgi:hypothetical protein